MKKRRVEFHLVLIALAILFGQPAFAQLYNQGSVITVAGGADLYVDGDVTNTNTLTDTAYIVVGSNPADQMQVTGVFNNTGGWVLDSGIVDVDSHFVSTLFNGTDVPVFINSGELYIEGDFDNAIGTFWDTAGAVTYLDGTGTQVWTPNAVFGDWFSELHVLGGGDKDLNGSAIVDHLELADGIIYVAVNDTLIGIDTVSDGNSSSYVDGRLIRSGTHQYFPVGVNGKFRPLDLPNITDSTIIQVELKDDQIPSTTAKGLTTIADTMYWDVQIDTASYTGSNVTLTFHQDDTTGMNSSALVVGRSLTGPVGEYSNLGSNVVPVPLGGGVFSVSNNVNVPDRPSVHLVVGGGCANARVELMAWLQGAWDSGDLKMHTDLNPALVGHFDGDTGDSTFTMWPSYSVPDSAVDLVDVIVRESFAPYNHVDTARAWMMDDGSVRDFETGLDTAVNFCYVNLGSDYHLELRHRNHLPIMTSAANTYTATNTPGTVIDYTNQFGTDIWGTGYYAQDGVAQMIGGNARNTDNRVNIFDYLEVIIDAAALPLGDYKLTDANLSGDVESGDNDIPRWNSLNIETSTAP